MATARTRKRRTAASSLAWARNPWWGAVHSGRFRNAAATDRRPKGKAFCVILHSDNTMTRIF